MKIIKEFKEFAVKWNVIDLAVWIVIWASFNKIVSSLVDNIIMPSVWILTAGKDFSELAITLAGTDIVYWAFIQSIVDFLIIAMTLFVFIRIINHLKKKEEIQQEIKKKEEQTELAKKISEETQKKDTCENKKQAQLEEQTQLLREMRDLLKK